MTGDRIEAAFGVPPRRAERLQGGDLSEVFRIELADGRVMAVKRGALVDVEARMLRALALAGAPVPDVLHAGTGLLCLEWLEAAPPHAGAWRELGSRLRALHDTTSGTGYGWPENYAFGALHIDNAELADWPAFWAERRLVPFLSLLPPELAARVETLVGALPERLPSAPRPALLHGDLWTGNLLFTDAGARLIDPACYHGDAEVDLAMLDLFGPPDGAFQDGYGDPAPGRAARRSIYQLWPALVHLQLFGSGYSGMVRRLLDESGV